MVDEFLLDRAYLGWGIPIFALNEKNEVLYHKLEVSIPVNLDAAQNVRKIWKESGIPAVWNETMNIIHIGFEDDEGSLYLFGRGNDLGAYGRYPGRRGEGSMEFCGRLFCFLWL